MRISGKFLLFDPEMISAQFLVGNVFLRGEQRDVENSNFQIFESALYLESVNMPLKKLRNGILMPFLRFYKVLIILVGQEFIEL